jgi:hypothetical protein
MTIDAKIHDNHFHYNGVNYFRGHAEEVLLGDVGEKETPSTQENYLAVQGNVPRNKLKIHAASRIDIHTIDIDSKDIGVSIDVPGKGSVAAGSLATMIKDETLSLLKLSVLPKDIVGQANESPANALDPLKQAGNKGRLVHQVFLIVEMKTAVTFNSATTFEVTGQVGSVTVTAKGGLAGSGGATITVSPGGTFAYLLLKPKWDANLQKNWKYIDDWEDDQWSLY